MEDDILDFFPEDHRPFDGEMMIIKSFYFETPARIYAARLREANIPSFVSNTTINIPFGNGGITLHIRKADQEKAAHIIHQLDKRDQLYEPPEDESFHDADHADIEYQRAISEKKSGGLWIIVFIIVMILAAAVAQYVYNKPLNDWWQ